jgi:colicin import membrane protein
MSDRHENSVLVALKELRGIEEDRVKREQEEARARIEADRAAKEAAERRAREDEAARSAAEEERLRRIEEEKLAKVREEHLRIEDAERRARVDGEMKLQEERMRLEIQARAGKSPLKAIIGVTVLLLGIGGAVVYKIQAANQAEREESARKFAQTQKEAAAARAELEKRLAAITHDMEQRLKAAKTDAERNQIRLEAQLAKREAAAAEEKIGRSTKRSRTGSASGDAPKPSGPRIPGKRDINDDILGGL